MEDPNAPVTEQARAADVLPESPAAAPVGAAAAPDLSRKVRRLGIWLIVLSVAVGLLVIAAGVIGWAAWSFSREFYGGFDPTSRSDQTKPIEQAVKNAYRDALDTVKVSDVKVDFGDTGGPGPFGPFAMGGSMPRVYAVSYRLKGSSVLVSGLVSSADDMGMNGLLPTEGSLASRLETTQVVSLMKAWEAESGKPMGGVRAYADPENMGPGLVSDTIEVAGKEYATKSLWRVGEGYDPALGPDIKMDDLGNGRDLIFFRDAKTREWTFLGSEQGQMSFPF